MKKGRRPATKRIASSEARANLAELLLAVGDRRERYLIERRGKPPVALLSADDFLQFQLLESRRAKERLDRGDGAKRGAAASSRRGRGAPRPHA